MTKEDIAVPRSVRRPVSTGTSIWNFTFRIPSTNTKTPSNPAQILRCVSKFKIVFILTLIKIYDIV